MECFAASAARSLTHGTYAACQETFFVNPSAPDARAAPFFQEMSCARSPTATYGEHVLKRESMKQIRTLGALQSTFAGNVSTWNPPSMAEGTQPQNSLVEQPKHQISETHFDKFSTPSTFQFWKTSFTTEACSCSGHPSGAMRWIKEAEVADSVDDLETSQSILGHRFSIFEMLDAKIASSPKKIIPKFKIQEERSI